MIKEIKEKYEPATSNYGVLTGFDSKFEWAWPWFYENLQKHNPGINVAVADFGMSDSLRQELKDKDIYVYPIMYPDKIWFRKPFAMMNSPFEKTIFCDIDIEVVGDVTELFQVPGLGLTEDPYNRWCVQYRKMPLASGVVVYSKGNWIVKKWAEAVVVSSLAWRGDQEALNAIISKIEVERLANQDTLTELNILHKKFQYLRLDVVAKVPCDDIRMIHWTGNEGKDIIKDKINKSNGIEVVKPVPKVEHKPEPKVVASGFKQSMPEYPLVSILMPAYNAEKTIDNAIEDTLLQKYENWELIITIDTKTNDSTLDIASSYVDDRIKIFEGADGYSKNFNAALKEAKGDIIARLDSDDGHRDDRLKQCVKAFKDHPNLDIFTSGAAYLRTIESGEHEVFETRPSARLDALKYMTGVAQMHPVNPGIIAKKAIYDAIGGFNESFDQAADTDWNMRVILGNTNWHHNSDILYFYRREGDSMTAGSGFAEQQSRHKQLVEYYRAKIIKDKKGV